MGLLQERNMKALRCLATEGSLSLEDIEVPDISSPDVVLVRVAFAGLCGTDLHILSGEFTNSGSCKVTMGHEFSGVVEKVGKDAAKRPCHKCEFCLGSGSQHCPNLNPVGIYRGGGMASFCLVPDCLVHLLPPGVTLEQGALCEPLSCILHGWQRLMAVSPPQPETRILIIGAGIIGNLWVSMFHHHGFRNVTVSEPAKGRREITNKLDTGFSVVDPSDVSPVPGFDLIVDCAGFVPATEKALQWTRPGATLLLFGCAPPGKTFQLSPEEVFRKELTILGSLINPNTYSRATKLAQSMGDRYLDCEKLGVGMFKIDEYEEAIDKLKKGQISKAMFKM